MSGDVLQKLIKAGGWSEDTRIIVVAYDRSSGRFLLDFPVTDKAAAVYMLEASKAHVLSNSGGGGAGGKLILVPN